MQIETIWTYTDEDGLNPLGLICDIEFRCKADFQPEEPMVRYYRDGSGYPGCPASLEIWEVKAIRFYLHLKDRFGRVFSDEESRILSNWMFGRLNEQVIKGSIEAQFGEDLENLKQIHED